MIWRVRLHPLVQDDLMAIADLVEGYAGAQVAERKLAEIEAVIRGLAEMPLKGSTRSEIAPGLRAIPAGRKGVVVFTVDEGRGEVLVHAVGYAGSDWIARSAGRR